MSELISLKIDLSKIDKEKIYKGEKGQYYTITINVKDEKDQFGNDVSAWTEQTKEERESKTDKSYIGSGKVFWKSSNNSTSNNSKSNDLPF